MGIFFLVHSICIEKTRGILINLFKKFKQYIKLEEQLIKNNKQDVKDDLDRLLKNILPVCFVLFLLLVLVSQYTKPKVEFVILYAIGAFVSLISYIVVLESDNYGLHLLTYYLAVIYIFILFTYIGAIERPNATGTSIVVLLALLPLLIPDNFLRVNGFLLAFYLIFCATALIIKPFSVGIEDVINVTCFTTIGFLLGNSYRHIKLVSFDVQRAAKENEHIDFLTNLPNRRSMYLNILEKDSDSSPVSITGVIMMDIDHFKLYNDSKGHIEGDLCLKDISRLFAKIAKEKQIEIYRYGGEEFIAFYYGLDEEKFDNIAHYIVNQVRNLNIPFVEAEKQILTISLGYTFSDPSENVSTNYLIDISDKALYLAKNSGRDNAKKI
ncbi:MAG: GGDEF domain-containing protein [Pleomorphochaeta sp.]